MKPLPQTDLRLLRCAAIEIQSEALTATQLAQRWPSLCFAFACGALVGAIASYFYHFYWRHM